MVDIPLINPFDSLEFEAKEVLEGDLGVGVPEAIGGPGYFSGVVDFLLEVVETERVLVEDIVEVADCFVVFDPAGVDDFELFVAN